MKAELIFPPELLDAIADKVMEKIRPSLAGCCPTEDDAVFDVDGLAVYLKMNKQWVYERIHRKDIPHYKVGKYCKFDESEVWEWLKKQNESE